MKISKKTILKSLILAIAFFGLVSRSQVIAQISESCSSSEVGQCDVCNDPLATCVNAGAYTGYVCRRIAGQCGATSTNTCNENTIGQCGVCPEVHQKCERGYGNVASCVVVTGQCGATSTNTCNENTIGQCGVCPNPTDKCIQSFDSGIRSFSCEQVPGQCGVDSQQMCCPSGYRDDAFACPFGTDLSTTCCKQTAIGQYQTAAKTSCVNSPVMMRFCEQIPEANAEQRAACESCRTANGVWSALGCIETTPRSIIARLMQIGISIAGGVALLMILAAAFIFSTSQGDPKRTSEAKELLSSAVIGLFFIIFSVTILQFIGVSLLRIPDFGI